MNLDTRTARKNGRLIIRNGRPVNQYEISQDPVDFDRLDELYQIYRTSAPDRIRQRHPYFRALDYHQMTPAEILAGVNRQSAREKLEMAVLEGSLNGSLVWPEDAGWFWQSTKNPDFVVLRKWVVHDA